MFVSRRKLRVIVDENVVLRKKVQYLKTENTRLSDNNLDLWYDNKLLNAKLMKKEGQEYGRYFYGGQENG